jgi:hypothetical protein
MRLGLLVAARASFRKASRLFNGRPSASLAGNINALEGHERFAESTGRDPNEMYGEYLGQAGGERGGGVDEDEYLGDHSMRSVQEKDTDTLTDEGIELVESGDPLGALSLFQAAIKLSPADAELWENVGVSRLRENKFDVCNCVKFTCSFAPLIFLDVLALFVCVLVAGHTNEGRPAQGCS